MKPTKNRFDCKDCGRTKMLFETEKKANTFIKFNSQEIERESGYRINSSYYCIYCNGWHVTSKAKPVKNFKTKTEKVLDLHKLEEEKKATGEKKVINASNLEKEIKKLKDVNKKTKKPYDYIEILDKAFKELEK